jgi:preprotein translocase subunit SecD
MAVVYNNKKKYSQSSRSAASRITIAVVFVFVLVSAFFVHPPLWDKPADFLNSKISLGLPHFKQIPFRLGLDLQGGTQLVYEADVSNVVGSAADALAGVRDVIERRVNLFGVAEPVVEVTQVGGHWRLIVELAGVNNVDAAIKQIGETPFLEFRKPRPEEETKKLLEELQSPTSAASLAHTDPYFIPTELNGKYLTKTQVTFDPQTNAPTVSLQFNSEGAKLFEALTKEFLNKPIAIYLDGAAISAPRVDSVISGGQAVISGNFSLPEAKQLAERMNAGALPVPIKIVSQDTVGAALGSESVSKSMKAGMAGFILVALFMIFWYRLPGVLAALALLCYVAIALFIFKIIPVTLTLAGIAGFILSIGIAVDANVLIFERMKEEFRRGFGFAQGINEGFSRAWPSIRDSNISSLITALILYWVGSGVVKGFAFTLIIGILVSLFSAIFITRSLLNIFVNTRAEKLRWLFLQNKNEVSGDGTAAATQPVK